MTEDHSETSPVNPMQQLHGALVALRDVLTELSLCLSDFLAESPSPENTALMLEVKQQLSRISHLKVRSRE